MSTRRFHCPDLAAGLLTLASEESHHAAHVIRVMPGDPVTLFDGSGHTANATIESVRRGAVTVQCGQPVLAPPPAGIRLTLLTATPRAPRQPFLIEKCTELAVARIVPIGYDRSTVTPRPAGITRWQRASIEAAKQSGADYLPVIDPPQSLDAGLVIAGETDHHYLAAPDAAQTLAGALAQTPPATLAVWIGPEGGLTDDEQRRIITAGAHPVNLGRQILRIETAALAVAACCRLLARGGA